MISTVSARDAQGVNVLCSLTQVKRENDMSDHEDKTLCALQEDGFIESHTEEFIKLIQPARYFCKNCGRSAVADKNLCNPESLS